MMTLGGSGAKIEYALSFNAFAYKDVRYKRYYIDNIEEVTN